MTGRLLALAAAVLLAGCVTRAGAIDPTPLVVKVPVPAAPAVSPLNGWPALESVYKGHGVHLTAVTIPVGHYTISWSAIGAGPDGCRMLVKLREDLYPSAPPSAPLLPQTTLVDEPVAANGTSHGTASMTTASAESQYSLTIDGTGCTWTVAFARS